MFSISRQWILIGRTIDEKYKSSVVKISHRDQKQISTPVLTITDKSSSTTQSIVMERDSSGFAYDLKKVNLKAGEYDIQAELKLDNATVKTPRQNIHVSYPLFVNWSIDWEGDGVEDRWIQALDKISDDYKVPMTHYFNPGIYVEAMFPQEKSKYVTSWLLNRQKTKGDEIGLHLHMWHKVVEAMGIPVRMQPNWDNQGRGHDVPTTSYTPEEFDKMIKWSKEMFKKNGLPEPKLYRAGGWQINADQMKVLVNNGFIADTSGRDYVKFGRNKMPVPWNLTSTTRPYKPSVADINKPGTPAIGLWEFPNNGDNSSNYGPTSTVINDKFKQNFNGSALKEMQTFSVLSHVQHFHVSDDIVIRKFFAESSKSLAENDSGPVIYTTINKILPEYIN
jgi:predicted deacetylase